MAPAEILTARARTRCNGGFTFAEHPQREAPEARIIWRADLDPGTILARAAPVGAADPDRIDPARLKPWLSGVVEPDGDEHVVLSDGLHHIRLECERGGLCAGTPVLLHYRLHGTVSAEPVILPLRRFLHLHRYRRFSPKLFARDSRVERWLTLLRVHDAVGAGASHRDIAEALFGRERVPAGRAWKSEALNARIDRLVSESRRMAAGGYRTLMLQAHLRDAGAGTEDRP